MNASSDPSQASRICLALMRVGIRMAVGFDQSFASLGLTQAQFRVIREVWNCGGDVGVTPTALAERLFLERATVSALLKKLFERELLARLPGENQRSYRVVLTESGRESLRQVIPHAQALADATFEDIPSGDLQKFEELLKTLEERLRADAREPSGPVSS